MLVGSCLPTKDKIRIVLLRCARAGCPHVISAVSEAEALEALNEHYRWAYGRQDSPHAQ